MASFCQNEQSFPIKGALFLYVDSAPESENKNERTREEWSCLES